MENKKTPGIICKHSDKDNFNSKIKISYRTDRHKWCTVKHERPQLVKSVSTIFDRSRKQEVDSITYIKPKIHNKVCSPEQHSHN